MAIQGDINLIENNIEDPSAQENFRRIKTFLRDVPVMKAGFYFRTFAVPAGLLSNFKYKHNLDFVPKDILVSALSNNASVTWHFDTFDKTYVYLTVTAPTTIRAFFGSYKDDNS